MITSSPYIQLQYIIPEIPPPYKHVIGKSRKDESIADVLPLQTQGCSWLICDQKILEKESCPSTTEEGKKYGPY